MEITVYKTCVQVGYQKAGALSSRGMLIQASYGTPSAPGVWTAVDMGKGEGVSLHARTKKPYWWWLADVWLAEGDLLKLTTKVAVAGAGQDEDRSMDLLFSIDPNAGVVEVSWPGIGYKDYPLARGCLREINRSTAANARVINTIEPSLAEAGMTKTITVNKPDEEGNP